MIETNVQTIALLCVLWIYGRSGNVELLYAEGALGAVTFTGRGECRTTNGIPELGMVVLRCFLELGDLPSGYVGGQLTTNTMGSRNGAPERKRTHLDTRNLPSRLFACGGR